jgi:endonuclease/exonuclease/phosphatase family metal-dependent hydrolase
MNQQKGENDNLLRVCSYNIHKGFNSRNTRFLLHEIRQAIRIVNADMLFLQEVVGEHAGKANSVPNWVSDTQFEFLADSVWPHHAYGKNAVYDHGHHGNAILSRYPLSHWKNVDLSLLPFSSRGVLHAKILGNLHLFCIHFGLIGIEQKIQRKRLVSLIKKHVKDDEPLIVAGDFNDWRSKVHAYLQNQLGLKEAFLEIHGKSTPTFPSFAPVLPMDRIYYRGLKLIDGEVLTGSPWSRLSDHCAIYAEFELE